jgi:phage terminase large subunit-like protein
VTGSASEDAAKLISLAGITLDPWQRLVLDFAMGYDDDEAWVAKTVDVLASRQNGKNVLAETRELYGAVILGERVTHTAHLFPTAKKSFKRIKSMVAAHPDLERQLVRKLESPSSGYSFEFTSGGVIEFIARSTTSGRGFTGDLLILDEAQDLNDDALGALLPTLSATSIEGDPQVWYLGSAPGVGSSVWQRRRHAGRAGGSDTNAYFEFSAHPDANLDDHDAWAQANPGLGVRISEAFIQETERVSMSDEMFARERLSISPDLADEYGALPGWDRVCDLNITAEAEFFAFDVNPERSAAAIVVAGAGPVIGVVDYRQGTGWLVDRLVELREQKPCRVVVDKAGPAGAFIHELRARNVRLTEIDSTDLCRACGAFYDAVTRGAVKVRSNPALDAGVAAAVTQPVGDAWRWGRKTSKGDISLLVAATLAHWAMVTKRPRARFISLAD